MSLARLLRHRCRPADAIACLQPIYDRFTEGSGTADLIAAKQLLDELSDARRREVCCWPKREVPRGPQTSDAEGRPTVMV
jgi:hypothetical protein